MEIFDTHAHYDDEAFDSDREELLSSVLPKSGVCGIITAGTNVKTSIASVSLAAEYGYIYFAAGVHPEDAVNMKSGDIDRIAGILKSSKKAVAVGEIGLDYHCDVDRELQKDIFERQLKLAGKLNLPVIIHDREAHADTLDLIKKYRPRGTVHCFSGSAETAKELLKLGMYLGFTGSVTFKNNKKAPEVLKIVPDDRILVETDCPFMAPVPLRGKRSDSSMISLTLKFIADIKGTTPEETAHITAQNARRLFGIN